MPRLALLDPVALPEAKDPIVCDLTGITAYNRATRDSIASYTYTIILRNTEYSSFPAHIKVPARYVDQSIQDDFRRDGVVHISRSPENQGLATLGNIIAEDQSMRVRDCTADGVYIRELTVSYRRLEFPGEICIPRTTAVIDYVDEMTAVPSIEPKPPKLPERRLVIFKHSWNWFKGYNYDVEVWSVEGEESFEGKAKVVRVDHRRTGEIDADGMYVVVRRLVVLTQVPDDADRVLLRGEMKDGMQFGQFEEIEEA